MNLAIDSKMLLMGLENLNQVKAILTRFVDMIAERDATIERKEREIASLRQRLALAENAAAAREFRVGASL